MSKVSGKIEGSITSDNREGVRTVICDAHVLKSLEGRCLSNGYDDR